jgi:sarcosine/dimethylglycine N-methyltransferase
MRQDDRAPFDEALHRARVAAYPPGEFVGQESFMRAGEILELAEAAGVDRGTSVLDLCCGVAGPGRLVTAELGCDYLGVDASAAAVAIARREAGGLPCRFEVAEVPPVPRGPFDVVMLLETLLAFEDKQPLLRGVVQALRPGGRFAFTVEEGRPLTDAERSAMPDADTVWLVELPHLVEALAAEGLQVRRQLECSGSHLAMVDALVASFTADATAIADRVGRVALDELLAAHRLWSSWLRSGRVRKFAIVAERVPDRSGVEAQQDPPVDGAHLH